MTQPDGNYLILEGIYEGYWDIEFSLTDDGSLRCRTGFARWFTEIIDPNHLKMHHAVGEYGDPVHCYFKLANGRFIWTNVSSFRVMKEWFEENELIYLYPRIFGLYDTLLGSVNNLQAQRRMKLERQRGTGFLPESVRENIYSTALIMSSKTGMETEESYRHISNVVIEEWRRMESRQSNVVFD